MKNNLTYDAELIRQADGILITAGAGMSVDSSLLDFRSVGGGEKTRLFRFHQQCRWAFSQGWL